jgi:hypothetical protein
MKLSLLDSMKMYILDGTRKPLPKRIKKLNYSEKELDKTEVGVGIKCEAEIQLWYRQVVDLSAPRYEYRRRALVSLANYVYGPIGVELELLREELWELGIKKDDPSVRRVERMLSVIRCEEDLLTPS